MNYEDGTTEGQLQRESRHSSQGAGPSDPAGDLLFDFTEVGSIDLPTLALLFTAQQVLCEQDEVIWVAGLPGQFWAFLSSMGLGGFFKPFPGHGKREA